MEHTKQGVSSRIASLSLNGRVCAAATMLVILSLAITGTVIGFNSSKMAEAAAMEQARILASQASSAVQGRLGAHLASLQNLADSMAATRGADLALSRPQVSTMVKATLLRAEDMVGASVTWEPNALDGKDAEFAGKLPEFDASGRFMPYFTRGENGGVNVEPAQMVGANPVYEFPRASGQPFFSEPYVYPVNGKPLLMASIAVPVMVKGQFRGIAIGDFVLSRLSEILASMQVMEGGTLALISNGGVYASHPDLARNGTKVDDMPAAALDHLRRGAFYEYTDSGDTVHLLAPLLLYKGAAPWAVRLSFPHSVALAPARALIKTTMLVAVLCALAAAAVLIMVLNRLMRPLHVLGRAVHALGGGDADLTQRLAVRGNDELSTIAQGFNSFIARIHNVLVEVRGSSECVAVAGSEIRQGNVDLSVRTEQQAVTLEQSAASMEELESTVCQTADNARDAKQLADTAAAVAGRAGAVITKVIETMASIKSSSLQVADIVGVIDGIAFQTNILALNAAVEAARAGEQGRGFAVVASEVRNLAQRSALAAREIKTLIQRSVQEVGTGSTLVDSAGQTMREVVSSVARVTETITAISSATEEQRIGITQISKAVGDMDSTTQQNAAMVEQAAAASDALEQQAVQLVRLVGQFKLSTHPHLNAVALLT
jgi:methyl-accepting chemotaxis protein